MLIAFIILIISFLGIIMILVPKLSVLSGLPIIEEGRTKWFVLLKEKLINYNPLKGFSFIKFLQKILLSTERQTNLWLKKIKEKTQAEKINSADEYWQQLKNTRTNIIKEKKSKIKKSVRPAKKKTAKLKIPG